MLGWTIPRRFGYTRAVGVLLERCIIVLLQRCNRTMRRVIQVVDIHHLNLSDQKGIRHAIYHLLRPAAGEVRLLPRQPQWCRRRLGYGELRQGSDLVSYCRQGTADRQGVQAAALRHRRGRWQRPYARRNSERGSVGGIGE